MMFACKYGHNDVVKNGRMFQNETFETFSTTVILGRFSTVARLSEKQAEARVKLKNFDNARQH